MAKALYARTRGVVVPRGRVAAAMSPAMNRRAFLGSLAVDMIARSRDALAQNTHGAPRIGILSFAGRTAELTGPEPQLQSMVTTCGAACASSAFAGIS